MWRAHGSQNGMEASIGSTALQYVLALLRACSSSSILLMLCCMLFTVCFFLRAPNISPMLTGCSLPAHPLVLGHTRRSAQFLTNLQAISAGLATAARLMTSTGKAGTSQRLLSTCATQPATSLRGEQACTQCGGARLVRCLWIPTLGTIHSMQAAKGRRDG